MNNEKTLSTPLLDMNTNKKKKNKDDNKDVLEINKGEISPLSKSYMNEYLKMINGKEICKSVDIGDIELIKENSENCFDNNNKGLLNFNKFYSNKSSSLLDINKNIKKLYDNNLFPKKFSYDINYAKQMVKSEDYKTRIKSFNKYLKYNVHKILNGKDYQYCLQTHELLKMVYQIKQDETKDSIKYKSGLAQYRDIRQLVSNNTNTRFDISPKRNCVLINLPYRKCIICKDFLYYIPTFTNSPNKEITKKEEHMCTTFIENAKIISSTEGSLPFEIKILESIFVDVCDELRNEIEPIITEADKLFEIISSNLSVYKCINKLTEMRRRLTIIDEKVQSVYKSIQAVLNNDEDIKRLEVSYFWDKPHLWDDCSQTPNNEDTEMLLEYYCHEIEEFIKTINRTDQSLDDVLQMVELNLDDARNNVLKLELNFKIYGIIISVVGTIAAVFGMNIKNGFENDQIFFWFFSSLLIIVSFFCLFGVFGSFKRVNI